MPCHRAMVLPVNMPTVLGVLKKLKFQITNIKQITMTKIVRASIGLPTLRVGPQFQNSKPALCFGH